MEPARPEHATPFEAIDQPHAEVFFCPNGDRFQGPIQTPGGGGRERS